VNIFIFMNKNSGIFNDRGGFYNEGLNLINKESGKGMSGGSNGAHYWSERDCYNPKLHHT
jgi:hypothetical protein